MSLRSFLKDRRGGVAPMFALAVIPVVGLIGMAVDYSRANATKTSIQAALDATALAMAKSAPTLTQEQLQDKADAYFKEQVKVRDAQIDPILATYTTQGGSQLELKASGSVNLTFSGVFGMLDQKFTKLDIATSSTIKWGNQRLRVALALDTTGSMASAGKIEALKTATKNLLDQLKNAAAQNGDVYVSIVPFARNVNAGASNHDASWIDWTDWEDEPPAIKTSKPSNWADIGPGSSCPFSNSDHGFRCTVGPTNGSERAWNIPSSGAYSGYICPSVDSGSQYTRLSSVYYNGCYNSVPTITETQNTVCSGGSCTCGSTPNCSCTGTGVNKVCKQTITNSGAPYTHNWIKNARSTWNGCMADRGNSATPSADNYDQKVTLPVSGTPASHFPAQQYGYCSPAVMPLSFDWTTMKSLVDDLYPAGSTNQPIGLVWGWQSLVGGGRFGTVPSKDANYTYKEVIILLSDGLNTQDRWYGNGSDHSNNVDNRMWVTGGAGTCKNAKDAGMTIYAIQVNTGGDPESQVMKNCASSDKFVMLTTANQIITTFAQIGTQLSQLRIAK
jgi:Flp pilus assembly protein TadG